MKFQNIVNDVRNTLFRKKEPIVYDEETSFFKGKRWPAYLIAFILPAFIMFLIYAAMRVFPFGDGAVLVLDLNGQYVYFFEELRNKIYSGSSLIYSWSRSLGGEFMGIFAYYIASPFSFLVALFPKDSITEALLTIFLLKVGSCGLTMSIYLDKKKPTQSLNNVIFSTLYALCSYAVVYMHNTMWIDEMIFLPLLILGIEKLIEERKPFLFACSLAFCLMTSFYIGYMMCIFTFLYFFYYYGSKESDQVNLVNEKNHFIKSLLRIALYSVIAIAIAIIVLWPAYVGLQFGKSDFTNPDYSFSQKFDFLDMLAKLYPGTYDSVTPSGLPWIYCGTLSLILLPLYFISKKINLREKMCTFGLFAALILSFNGSTIDIFWHGMQKPNWLNYRYSFMFIFIMIVCAYKVFCDLESFDYKYILGSVAVLALLIIVIQKFDYEWLDDLKAVWYSLVCLAIFGAALHPVAKGYLSKAIRTVILIIISLELFCSGLIYNVALDEEVSFSSRIAYRSYMDKLQPVVDTIKQYDKDNYDSAFYRMDKDFYKKTNDNMTLGMYGLSLSSSMLNQSVIDLLANMGYASMSHWSKYCGGTPVSDSLLGVKYVIREEDTNTLLCDKIYSDYEKSLFGYYNPYAIQLAAAVDEDALQVYGDTYNTPFEYLNAVVTKMLGETKTIELFKPLENYSTEENLEMTYSSGNRKYSKVASSREGKITFNFTTVGNNEVFCFFPCNYKKEVSLLLNGSSYGSYFENDTYRVLSLGEFEDNEEVYLSMILEESYVYLETNVNYFYYLDTELFKEIMPQLLNNTLEVTHFEDTKINGTITSTEDKNLIYTSIPYDEGWKVFVDGKQVETEPVLESLISFKVDAGTHNIEFKYEPDCIKYGLIISIAGLISLIACWFVRKKIYKNSLPIESEGENSLDKLIEELANEELDNENTDDIVNDVGNSSAEMSIDK